MDAIILTAGKGTRLFPLTKSIPKPLFPIAGEPLIYHILNALGSEVNRVILVIGHKADFVKQEISKLELPFDIKWVIQDEQKGTGHAVKISEQYVTTSHVFVMYGDIFTSKQTIKEILSLAHSNAQNNNIFSAVEVVNPEKYGCLETRDDYLIKILEKDPKPISNNVNAGIMVLPSAIFDTLSQTPKSSRGEIEITDGINKLIEKGTRFKIYHIRDFWIDIGYPWNIIEANEAAMSHIEPEDQIDHLSGVTIEGKVKIASNVILRPGSFIQGPCIIDENSIIGPNCFIRPGTYLGKNVRVGNGVEIKNSIILDNTTIGHLSYLGDSIIGKGCNFGAGTKIANLKLDKSEIGMVIKDKQINTGRKKLGIIMGDEVKTGINVSFMPGVVIGDHTHIGAHTLVNRNIPSETLYYYDPDRGIVQKSLNSS